MLLLLKTNTPTIYRLHATAYMQSLYRRLIYLPSTAYMLPPRCYHYHGRSIKGTGNGPPQRKEMIGTRFGDDPNLGQLRDVITAADEVVSHFVPWYLFSLIRVFTQYPHVHSLGKVNILMFWDVLKVNLISCHYFKSPAELLNFRIDVLLLTPVRVNIGS